MNNTTKPTILRRLANWISPIEEEEIQEHAHKLLLEQFKDERYRGVTSKAPASYIAREVLQEAIEKETFKVATGKLVKEEKVRSIVAELLEGEVREQVSRNINEETIRTIISRINSLQVIPSNTNQPYRT